MARVVNGFVLGSRIVFMYAGVNPGPSLMDLDPTPEAAEGHLPILRSASLPAEGQEAIGDTTSYRYKFNLRFILNQSPHHSSNPPTDDLIEWICTDRRLPINRRVCNTSQNLPMDKKKYLVTSPRVLGWKDSRDKPRAAYDRANLRVENYLPLGFELSVGTQHRLGGRVKWAPMCVCSRWHASHRSIEA